MIRKAKMVDPNRYKFPTRAQLGGNLLEWNHDHLMKRQKDTLKNCADVFGVALYSDGATVKRMPLLNILASGVFLTTACLEIVDCTQPMRDGQRKTGVYIFKLIEKHILDLEEIGVPVTALFFDGASNVQKAGRLAMLKYPRISSKHGTEHVMSLVMQDIFEMRVPQLLRRIYSKLHLYFGGSHHDLHAVFTNFTEASNGGRKIGLLRPSDTRMGGHRYALARLVRLKVPLQQVVRSEEATKKLSKHLVQLVLYEPFWTFLYHFLRMMYAPIKVLRLSDRKDPAMDKLYFFVRRCDEIMEESRHHPQQSLAW